MNVPFLGGNGVETSIRKDVAGDKAHRNTKKNILVPLLTLTYQFGNSI